VDLPPRVPLPAQADPVFDRLAHRVAAVLDAPVALVSLVDNRGQTMPGAVGLAEPWSSERWTPLSHSFCQHVVASGRPVTITNAHDHPLGVGNLAVMELGVVAYAGAPLQVGDGPVVGAVCAIDHRPRTWTMEQLSDLSELAAECSKLLRDSVQP
jgi:GAF domain-containing protein